MAGEGAEQSRTLKTLGRGRARGPGTAMRVKSTFQKETGIYRLRARYMQASWWGGVAAKESEQAGRWKGQQTQSGQAASSGEVRRAKFPRGGETVLVFMGASGSEQRGPCTLPLLWLECTAPRLCAPQRRGGGIVQVLGRWDGLGNGVDMWVLPSSMWRGSG